MQGTFTLPPVITVLFVAREGLTGRSFRSLPIGIILCIPRRRLRLKWCSLPPRRRNFFFNSVISRSISFSFFAWDTWLFPHDWLLLVCVVCPLCSRPPLCWGLTPEQLCCEPPDAAWCGLSLPWCGPAVGWCEPDSSILCAKPKSLSDQIKQVSHRRRQL